MSEESAAGQCDIGVIGLGVMGRNFALNLADHGYVVAGYDRDGEKIAMLAQDKTERQTIRAADNIEAFCALLRRPRAVIMLVPAGQPVDQVIQALETCLEAGDLVVDSGNSHFTDTDRRSASLMEKGLLFLGMGMSGGETGARSGPSLMPGGSKEGYERIKTILEAAAAHTGPTACVAYLGPGSAGHYVKMVHNGIEYGLMQLISETYDLMKRGLGMHPQELHMVYRRWQQGELNSYLMGITADIFLKTDERTGQPLVDMILDRAEQKGTGKWTAAEALAIKVPTLNIDAAVMMRHMSGYKDQRLAASQNYRESGSVLLGDKQAFIDRLENALHAATFITYAQGMALLRQASRTYGYDLKLETVARIWTGGCIIRARLLEEIQSAYRDDPELVNMLISPPVSKAVETRLADLREVVRTATDLAIPVPGLMMALAYHDAYRSSWLPANLIMAQRDYFGSHTYQRVDAGGSFHTQWNLAQRR